MDFMSKVDAINNDPERRRTKEARRQVRTNTVYKKITQALGKEASGWNIMQDVDVSGGRPVGSQHPAVSALLVAREELGNFKLPKTDLRYIGMKRVSGNGAYNIDDGVVVVEATIQSHIGHKHYVDIPLIVKEGRILAPSVLLYKGNLRVITQGTFDDILTESSFKEPSRDRRNMFSPGNPEAVRMDIPIIRPRMFPRASITAAVRKTAFYTQEVSGEVLPGQHGATVPGADGSHLDVAERPYEGPKPGQKVSVRKELKVRDRGGVAYTIPSGTDGVVIRDMDGAQRAYYVKFDELGFSAIVPGGALK